MNHRYIIFLEKIILLISCCVLSSGVFAAEINSQPNAVGKKEISSEFINIIGKQLEALRNNDVEAAYYATAQAFQESTSLEEFKKFVDNNPILTHYQSISVRSLEQKGDQIQITLALDPNGDNIPLTYILEKDKKGEWKIWNINIVPKYSPEVAALLKNPNTMIPVIEGQLQAIKNNEIVRAYVVYTSDQFQKKISLEDFRKFVEKYPMLSQYDSMDIKTPVYNKLTSTGTVDIDIKSKNSTITLEYTLGVEGNVWKIWSAQIIKQSLAREGAPPEESVNLYGPKRPGAPTQPVPGALQFDSLDVGSKIDDKGQITEPLANLKSPYNHIYVELDISHGTAGERVEVHLSYEESNSHLPPISTNLQQSGESSLTFDFAPPSTGWPKGHYILEAFSSTGGYRSFTFELR
jgi:hypothetical protein